MKSTSFICLLFLNSIFLHHTSSSVLFPKEASPTKSGYLPVNPTTGSAIFYAFYEAQTPTSPLSQTPLLIWLQGGPGCSSMLGNFLEVGPWRVTQNITQHLTLEPNLGSWNRIFGILFLDNPIGSGFSFAATGDEIPRDQIHVAKHLFDAITGFINLDPLFKNRPIYLTGESYAGKYIPSIGSYILNQNKLLPMSKRVNLHGVAIGNGLTDPESQVSVHALNAYFFGLINQRQKYELEKAQAEAIRLVKIGNWSEATNARTRVLNLLQNMTGLVELFDFTRKDPYPTSLVTSLLRLDEVKKAFGAKDSIVFDVCSDVVMKALHDDLMKSAKFMVEFLVKNIKVLLYQGNNDLKDGVASTESWVKTIRWEGIESFLMAERKVWKVKELLAGYVQKSGNLSTVVILDAGHLMPTDQPLKSQVMIEDWVLDKGLFAKS